MSQQFGLSAWPWERGADGTAAAAVIGVPALRVLAGCIDCPGLPGRGAHGDSFMTVFMGPLGLVLVCMTMQAIK